MKCGKIYINLNERNKEMEQKQIKVLIGDNTSENGVRIAAELIRSGIYAYTRSKDGRSILNSIMKDAPDVVIIDLTLKDTDAVAVMQEVKQKCEKQPAFIVTSEVHNKFIERQVIAQGASLMLKIPYDDKDLSSIVKSVVDCGPFMRSDDAEIMVTYAMRKLGIPAHIKGYYYLRSAILLVLKDADLLKSMTKQIYPKVAEIYDTTPSRVERAIRHAIEIAWSRSSESAVSEYFGYSSYVICERPTNSEFIAFSADKIRLQLKANSRDNHVVI